jgi:hypothetical protein
MTVRELIIQMRDYAGLGPGLVVALAVSIVTSGVVSRSLGTSRLHGGAVVMGIGLVLAATVTPSREALLFGAVGSGTCDMSRVGLPSWWELRHISDATLNILLFVPLGLAIGACPPSPARRVVLLLAFALPVAIELIQLLVLPLGRECQSSDVVDNVIGLAAGILAARAAHLVASSRAVRSRDETG